MPNLNTNTRNRVNLLGDSRAGEKDMLDMSDVIAIEKERFSQKLPNVKKTEL